MKLLRHTLACAIAAMLCVIPVCALPGPHGAPAQGVPLVLQNVNTTLPSYTWPDGSVYTTASSEQLWEDFAQAEAYKKLYEMKEKAIREQLRLFEGPGACCYYYSGADSADVYTQLQELKSQEYALKVQKEQYEWQKQQAEAYLKMTGAKPDKENLRYALYTGAVSPSGLSGEELYAQRYSAQVQEQQAEWQKKNLEYQYQLGQLSDSDFVAQYAAAFQQKETIKAQREKLDVEIQMAVGVCGPGMGVPLLP